MKRNSLKILSAVVTGMFVLGTVVYAQNRDATDSRIGSISQRAIEATPITKADADKKYPPRGGHYPPATRDPHYPSGVVMSPFPPYQQYDCSKVAHGGLVLDTRAKRVFVYP
ncbi:MAG: hypothetical protein J2P56_04565 [Verrucomicrobia bacterium]|nr:hypothetical protein [Verrucomicrobiota bacterium]